MEAAKGNRWGSRDATMVLLAYRHGLRAAELVDLRWDQLDFETATLHVRRVKKGTPATHPVLGDELRALPDLKVSLDSLAVLEETMRHFYLKAKVERSYLGPNAGWKAVDAAMLQAAARAREGRSRRTGTSEAWPRCGSPANSRGSSRRRYARRVIGADQAPVYETRPAPRPGGCVRAGGVENGGRLDRGGFNDRAPPAFRSLRRAGRVPPLGMEREGRQPFIALAVAAGAVWVRSLRPLLPWAARARAVGASERSTNPFTSGRRWDNPSPRPAPNPGRAFASTTRCMHSRIRPSTRPRHRLTHRREIAGRIALLRQDAWVVLFQEPLVLRVNRSAIGSRSSTFHLSEENGDLLPWLIWAHREDRPPRSPSRPVPGG